MRKHHRYLFLATLIFTCACSISSTKKVSVIHPEWSNNATIYEVNVRQYTPEGTFKAFIPHMERLKKMGIDILWLMPIHPIGEKNRKGNLGSYYSVRDYKAVNPEFGTAADLRDLVQNAHKLGMKVILDWVANHTAWDNVWVTRHPEFYVKTEDGEFVPPVKDWQDVIDLNYENNQLWDNMIDALKYWVEEFDIDGYRCDVADMVPTEFWNRARKELDEIKPVFMLAEAAKPEQHEQAFDMTYNWQLKDVMNGIAAGEKSTDDFRAYIDEELKNYNPDDFRMCFTTNHDENTWHGSVFERLGKARELFAALTIFAGDVPLVYSGQEAGLDKRLKFFEKDTIIWKNDRLEEVYKKSFALKHENHALWNGLKGGKLREIPNSLPSQVFSFVREKGENVVVGLFNLSGEECSITLQDNALAGKMFDRLLTEEKVSFFSGEPFHLKPWGYKIYYR